MKFWVLNSNNGMPEFIGAAIFAILIFNSCVASDKLSTINLPDVIMHLEKFHPHYDKQKMLILDKEKLYIAIADQPEKALKNRKHNLAIINRTRRFIQNMDVRMTTRIEQLDKLIFKADDFCAVTEEAKFEADCIKLHDNIQLYEAEISTYMAMIEVMAERYKAAKEVLK